MEQPERQVCYDISNLIQKDGGQIDESILEDYQCQICLQDVVNDPIMCTQCDKIFGFQCAKSMKKNKNNLYQCPNCKKEWESELDSLRNRFARDQIAKFFLIKCENADLGCEQTSKCRKEDIERHQKTCDYAYVTCKNSNKKCNWKGLRKDLLEHEQNQCGYQLIPCTQCRDNKVRPFLFYRKQKHWLSCPNQQSKCKFCSISINSTQLEEHESTCEKRNFTCKMCQKQFNGQEFLAHQLVNCYQKGQETDMFQKLLDIIEIQQKHIKSLSDTLDEQKKSQAQLEQNYENLSEQLLTQGSKLEKSQDLQRKENIFLNILSSRLDMCSKSRKQIILEDYKKGILHMNDLLLLYQVLEELELQDHIKSVYINVTDLGTYRKSHKSKFDFYKCVDFIVKLAEGGDQYSRYSLSFLYFHGDKQISKDLKLSQYWAEQCIDSGVQTRIGLSEAYWMLGLLYFHGNYQEQVNFRKSLECFQKSISYKQYAPALFGLGKIYHMGYGAPKNDVLAVNYFIKSSSLGYHQGLQNLAKFYLEGIEKKKNLEKSFDLYFDAAEKGNKLAMEQLAQCYQNGIGIEKCFQQAQAWKDKAVFFENNYM